MDIMKLRALGSVIMAELYNDYAADENNFGYRQLGSDSIGMQLRNMGRTVVNDRRDMLFHHSGVLESLEEVQDVKLNNFLSTYVRLSNVGTKVHRAPSLFKAMDVYSFAMTFFEIVIGSVPEDVSLTVGEVVAVARRPKVQVVLETTKKSEDESLSLGSTLPTGVIRADFEMPFKLYEFELAKKRILTRNRNVDKICVLLESMEEASRVDGGPNIWNYVANDLWNQYGYDRSSNSI
jgi:hypothetical protein